ncbi:hypothetical protein SRHO_G00153420 [Serrasalmus rhombeus]
MDQHSLSIFIQTDRLRELERQTVHPQHWACMMRAMLRKGYGAAGLGFGQRRIPDGEWLRYRTEGKHGKACSSSHSDRQTKKERREEAQRDRELRRLSVKAEQAIRIRHHALDLLLTRECAPL